MAQTFIGLEADAWSAIGTFVAAGLALWLPGRSARKEWDRQDRIRAAEKAEAQAKVCDVHQEVCSTVDRIIAYYDIQTKILAAEPQFIAFDRMLDRINMQVAVLREMLGLLEKRPELSDGALFSAVGGKVIAQVVEGSTLGLINTLSKNVMSEVNWPAYRVNLASHRGFVDSVKARNQGVRNHHKLGTEVAPGVYQGSKGQAIREKYEPLISLMHKLEPGNTDEIVNRIAEGEG